MTTAYHGTPITPRTVLDTLAGYCFTVSFARPADVNRAHQIGAGVMLDNGAFSIWTRNLQPDWPAYYRWTERWLKYDTTWAVIPDIIDAGDTRHQKYDANDQLIREWPHGHRGAPVWHMHEHLDRLLALAEAWPRVCIGSSRQYRTVATARWHGRMTEAMNALHFERPPKAQIHMLRGLQMAGSHYCFNSVDSTNIGRNHNRKSNAAAMAAYWSTRHCPTSWSHRPVQEELHALSLRDHRPRHLPHSQGAGYLPGDGREPA